MEQQPDESHCAVRTGTATVYYAPNTTALGFLRANLLLLVWAAGHVQQGSVHLFELGGLLVCCTNTCFLRKMLQTAGWGGAALCLLPSRGQGHQFRCGILENELVVFCCCKSAMCMSNHCCCYCYRVTGRNDSLSMLLAIGQLMSQASAVGF
jgi:hypothetical protein